MADVPSAGGAAAVGEAPAAAAGGVEEVIVSQCTVRLG